MTKIALCFSAIVCERIRRIVVLAITLTCRTEGLDHGRHPAEFELPAIHPR